MIYRSKRPARYTIVNNNLIENETLSLPAIGLLIYLLHKPDDWEVYPKNLAAKLYKKAGSKAGYRYILELINELEKHGYCKKVKKFDGTVDYFIYDEPNAEIPQEVEPNAEIQHYPNAEKPHVEIPHDIINTNLITNTNYISSSAEPNDVDFFNEFWNIYPRKSNKSAAKKKFNRLNAKKQQQIITLTRYFADDMKNQGRAEEHILLPTTYLNQERHLDYEQAQTTAKNLSPKEGAEAPVDPVEIITGKIKLLVKKYKETQSKEQRAALNARSYESFEVPNEGAFFSTEELDALRRSEASIADFAELETVGGEIKRMMRSLV